MEYYEVASQTFGEFNRYKLTLAQDRFGKWVAFVDDAEQKDEATDLPKVIAQVQA